MRQRPLLLLCGLLCGLGIACVEAITPWLSTMAQAQPVTSVAILPLSPAAGSDAHAGLGSALAGMLMADLSLAPSLRIVERSRVNALLEEIELGSSALIDPATAQRAGRGVGAACVVVGSWSVVGTQFLMDARIVEVESGSVLKAAKAHGEVHEFVSVEKELVESLLDGLAVSLNGSQRRQLMIETPTESFSAMSAYAAGTAAARSGDGDEARSFLQRALELDASFDLARQELLSLDKRVTKLEMSGGLILRPELWQDYLHNFRLQLSRGEGQDAASSLKNALDDFPARTGLWAHALDVPTEARTVLARKARSEPALVALLAEDLDTLGAIALAHPKEPGVQVLTLALLQRQSVLHPPAIPVLQQCLAALEATPKKAIVKVLAEDPVTHGRGLTAWREALEGSEMAARILDPRGLHRGDDRSDLWSGNFSVSGNWGLQIVSPGGPNAALEFRLKPDPAYKHSLPSAQGANDAADLFGDPKAAKAHRERLAALRKPGVFGWYVPRNDGRSAEQHQDPFDTWQPISSEAVACEREVTGVGPPIELCTAVVNLQKVGTPAGPYLLSSRAAGGPALVDQIWLPEFLQAPLTDPDLGPQPLGTVIDMHPVIMVPPRSDSHWRKYLRQVPLGNDKGIEWVMVINVCWSNSPRNNQPVDGRGETSMFAWNGTDPVPGAGVVPLITYDWDYRAGSVTREPETYEEWARYTRELIANGISILPGVNKPGSNCAVLPLPNLERGMHRLCLVAQLPDGGQSPEATCMPLEWNFSEMEGHKRTKDDRQRADAYEACDAMAHRLRVQAWSELPAKDRGTGGSALDRALGEVFRHVDKEYVARTTRGWARPDMWGGREEVRRWCQLSPTVAQRTCALKATGSGTLQRRTQGLKSCMN